MVYQPVQSDLTFLDVLSKEIKEEDINVKNEEQFATFVRKFCVWQLSQLLSDQFHKFS